MFTFREIITGVLICLLAVFVSFLLFKFPILIAIMFGIFVIYMGAFVFGMIGYMFRELFLK